MRIHLNIFAAIFPVIYHDKQKDNVWITRDIRISCHWKEVFIFSVEIVMTWN